MNFLARRVTCHFVKIASCFVSKYDHDGNNYRNGRWQLQLYLINSNGGTTFQQDDAQPLQYQLETQTCCRCNEDDFRRKSVEHSKGMCGTEHRTKIVLIVEEAN